MRELSRLATLVCWFAIVVPAQNVANIKVSAGAVSNPVPNDFLGLSVELSSVSRFFGSTPANTNPVLINLIRNLGQGTLRIGGNSQDEYCWAGATAPNPGLCTNTTSLDLNLLESLFQTSASTGWPVLMGLNLAQANSPGAGAWMLNEVTNGIMPAIATEGGSLLGLELGNEIDLFVQDKYRTTYTPADQATDVLTFANALEGNSSTAQFTRVAPAYSNYTVSKLETMLPQFLSGVLGPNASNLGLVTIHAYPTNVCSAGSTVTAAQLLTPANVTKVQDGFTYALSQVAQYGLNLQIGETNSTACSGQNGVSNAQASALWGMDHMLNTARLGIRRMNFHMGGTSYYNAVQASSTNGFSNQVEPLYYAMYLFQAAKGQSFLPVTLDTSANIRAYALSACAGCPVYLYVINKDLSAVGPVSVSVPAAGGDATLLALSAPSVDSLAAEVSYGGVQFNNATGALTGTPQTSVVVPDSNGVYTFDLPNAAAVLLTIPQTKNGPAALEGTVSSRNGPAMDRTWDLTLTNNGSGAAAQTMINAIILTQQFGTACTPAPVSEPTLPALVGTIAPGASGTLPVAWNFSGCPANARFALTFSHSTNSGATSGTVALNNLFQ
jgi:Glycosyl hydrolase family 79 C-terminal beta domain